MVPALKIFLTSCKLTYHKLRLYRTEGIVMNSQLIQDTQFLLEQYIAPQTNIQLQQETSPLPLDEMASLLHACQIPYVRKAVIMGCYYLLCLAVMRHRDVTITDQGLGDAAAAR